MWSAELLGLFLGGLLATGPASELLRVKEALETRRAENQVLHRRLEWGNLVRVADGRPAAPRRTPVTVVHLWAVECPSCLEELRWFRSSVQAWRSEPALSFAFVCETPDTEKIRQFLAERRDAVPLGEHYKLGSGANRLRASIQAGQQPITLVIDDKMVIRHAIIGPIIDPVGTDHRKTEFTAALTRLVALTRNQ